ncbi:MAG: D-alanyl-D-alanine carboxypeptidase [Clostridia bacterium]|nr:D-alanyl-D-alanine carboxypeptidase [Clostridia bacterium]
MKQFCCIFLCFLIIGMSMSISPVRAAEFSDNIDAASVILMEAETGTVLFEQNADEALPPASVTKVMTMLLVFEALDEGKISLSDIVTVSDYASGMGGSQVYLKAGETISVHDLLKSLIIASANDAAVALAEYVAGSEGSFIAMMNKKAEALGMKNTVFKNTNGLDDDVTGHLTSARDIALMTRELLKHELVFDYTTIWMDSIRNGAFGLTNTNRLVRFYRGCNGLKTGSTSKAGFCISATAERDGMQLICVIMGSSTKDARNSLAASLLDWGFANYAYVSISGDDMEPVYVKGGDPSICPISFDTFSALVTKGTEGQIKSEILLPESFAAPITEGATLGSIQYKIGDSVLGTVPIIAGTTVQCIDFGTLFLRMLRMFSL